ncbi:MAG: apolipoprotein N-acyltransferase [Alphaproteobacteria bacterium]|nr:apolipoprotein N-acyltransferase [Alphaproteobacteria bacterium]
MATDGPGGWSGVPVDAVARWFANLRGWRRNAVAAGLGTVATLALPPVYLLPVLYIAFAGLVWMLPAGLRRRTAFFTGWWFGMGYFVSSLYWIGFAPVTYSIDFLWVLPFAVVGLPIILAVFHGTATLLASLRGDGNVRRALMLALAWGATEWLRGEVLTGFPWNLAGYGWLVSDALAQSAAVFGMYGVTLLAVTAAALAAGVAGGSARRRWLSLGLAVAIPAVAWAGGSVRLAGAPALADQMIPGVGLRLVQANIPQREKWDRRLIRRNFNLQMSLSVDGRPDWITHIVWPETAATIDLTNNDEVRKAVAGIVPEGGLLLTGTPRRARAPDRVWNAMIALDGSGNITAVFDKFHLVPFGEYMPLRAILPFDKITPGTLDFSAGPGPQTIDLAGLPPVSPLICYEAIFPGETVDPARRPGWLLNLTNDAWYGDTAGPHQHLAITRARAIEEGIPLVRSANTGISAVFDSYGRKIGRIGLSEQGTLDTGLPKAATSVPLYARLGDYAHLFLMAIVFLSLLRAPNN